MEYVSGHILSEDGFHKGYICIKDGHVINQKKGVPPKTPFKSGLIVPTFINMHTHVGDAFIRNRNISLPNDIMQLVAPPDGLKHRLLKDASEKEIAEGIKKNLKQMNDNGTCHFVDFRENGVQGITLLRKALEIVPMTATILARPTSMSVDKNEINDLLRNAEGVGLSSISDWDTNEIQEIAALTHKADKLFALHASERVREDIESILNLEPSFLVHMSNAKESDLMKTKKADIPIVICPRSNHFFNVPINISLLKKTENTILIGTDNAMLHEPSIIMEIQFILKRFPDMFTIAELLSMITYAPRKALNLKDGIPQLTFPASFLVLHQETLEPLYRFQSDE
jgi:cytosine/adenosine deaminase-related metal-dependent hydrolase